MALVIVRSAEQVSCNVETDSAQVETYAQRFRFSRADYEDTADRLRQVPARVISHEPEPRLRVATPVSVSLPRPPCPGPDHTVHAWAPCSSQSHDCAGQVKRVLKQHGALDSTELLGRAARAEADLELWYGMEGAPDATSAV